MSVGLDTLLRHIAAIIQYIRYLVSYCGKHSWSYLVKMGIHLYYKWDKPKQMDKVAVRVLLVVVGCMLFLHLLV